MESRFRLGLAASHKGSFVWFSSCSPRSLHVSILGPRPDGFGSRSAVIIVSLVVSSSTMTTAHRPTWKAAVGRADEGGWNAGGAISTQRSALDAPAHLSLKTRPTTDRQAALQQSLLELNQAEEERLPKRKINEQEEEQGQLRLLKQTTDVDETIVAKYDDDDVDDGGGDGSSSESDLDDSDDDGSSSDEEEEDDEAALQAELAKIRAEREEQRRKEQEAADEEETAKQEEAALLGNPLLAGAGAGSKKRRWNEDVVFRNQAKSEPKPQKRFINDTVRNDFHKRFLNKFIR